MKPKSEVTGIAIKYCLQCWMCGSKNIDEALPPDEGGMVYCVDCGAMPNEEGYTTHANAVRGFRRMMNYYKKTGRWKYENAAHPISKR